MIVNGQATSTLNHLKKCYYSNPHLNKQSCCDKEWGRLAGALFIEAAINNSLEGWKKEQWMALGGSKNRLSHGLYKCLNEETFIFEENEKKKKWVLVWEWSEKHFTSKWKDVFHEKNFTQKQKK